jgi:HAD superfamily hydrolase (TIGR01509 family)
MNRPLKAKAVIFDRDGIIINTEGVVIDSVRKAFEKLGFTLQEEDLPHIIGRSVEVYKEYFLKKWDFNYEEFSEIRKDLFYKNLDSAPYFDNAVELIKKLYIKKIPIAVTTSAGKEGTLLILKKAGIDNMFKVIVTKEDCSKLKPDPEPYRLTSEKLGIEPRFCVAVEDTALGIESAKNAGMLCIAIPNEFTKDQDFSKADLVLESANEIGNILEFI